MAVIPFANQDALCSPRSRLRDFFELSIGYSLILLVIWTPQPWQRMFFWLALAWVVAITAVSFDGVAEMGLRASGFLRSLWIVGLALLIAVISFTLADQLHVSHLSGTPGFLFRRFWGYAIWAFLQEFLLLDFFLLRLMRLLPNSRLAVAGAAALFTIAHLPSPILTTVTFVWGMIAGLLFLRYRNLYTLGLAHVIFGVCVAVTIPLPVTHNMKVGLGYVRYRPPVVTALH